MISFQNQLFHLKTPQYSCLLRITPHGHLEQLHFGAPIFAADAEALSCKPGLGWGSSVLIRQGDTVLEVFIKPNYPERVTNPEAKGLRHLAFHVEALDAAVQWLNSVGIATEPIRVDKVNGGRFTFFKDPDGLPLELHE